MAYRPTSDSPRGAARAGARRFEGGALSGAREPHPIVGMMKPLASTALRGQRLVMAFVRV